MYIYASIDVHSLLLHPGPCNFNSAINCIFKSHFPQVHEKPNYYYPKSLTRDYQGQGLTCYEYIEQQGDSVALIDNVPALINYDFNNRASSCCFHGM